jgi:hypothetical protein
VLESSVEQFTSAVRGIVGKRCWGVAAGPATGSVLNLHIGDLIPRPWPIPNPELPESMRDYDGEFGLLVECAWRVETAGRIICSWLECESDAERREMCVRLLTGQEIENIEVRQPFLDLAVLFRNDHVLRLFCDQTEPECDNYVVFTPHDSWVVVQGAKLQREPRTGGSGT